MAGQGSSQENKARPGQRRMAQWTRDYARLPGIPDEYIGQDGAPRAVWSRFFDAFAALSPADIERRFASADRHLREAGVTYRAPGETADRLWPLSHLPLIIDEAEWQQLTAGIAQRAQLLEMVLQRSLRRGPAGHRRRGAGGRDCRQQRISARRLRRQTARRPPSSLLCGRCRPRSRRALVGVGRPHAGAVGGRLRAGKSPGAVARLFQPLQVDECRARGAVLRGVPRFSCAPAPTATSRGSGC